MLTLAAKKQLLKNLFKIQKACDEVSIPLDAQSDLTKHVGRVQMILIGWGAEMSALIETLQMEIDEDMSRLRMMRKVNEMQPEVPQVPEFGAVLDNEGEDWSDLLRGE